MSSQDSIGVTEIRGRRTLACSANASTACKILSWSDPLTNSLANSPRRFRRGLPFWIRCGIQTRWEYATQEYDLGSRLSMFSRPDDPRGSSRTSTIQHITEHFLPALPYWAGVQLQHLTGWPRERDGVKNAQYPIFQ